MKRGPKPKPLYARVQARISSAIDVASEMMRYPRPTDDPGECWVWTGAQTRSKDGCKSTAIIRDPKPRPVVRALIETACGEPLGPTWRPMPQCPNPNCVNPNHYEIRAFNINRFGTPEALPRLLAGNQTQPLEEEIDEIMCVIMGYDDRPTPERFVEICAELSIEVTRAVIDAAYEKIRTTQ